MATSVSVLTSREPEVIPISSYTLSLNDRDVPEMCMAISQVSTLPIVCDVVVRCVDRSPVCVALGVIVEELVLVCTISCGAVG